MARHKVEIDTLRDKDLYSLVLFALFKLRDIPEYSALSELAYILDKDNMLKLCEYFGGLTLKVPTIDELEGILYSLVLYQQVQIEGRTYDEAINMLGKRVGDMRKIKADYEDLVKVLSDYQFEGRKTS